MKKYKLIRTYVNRKTGSPLFPGIYADSQLPKEIINNVLYCLPLESIEVAVIPKVEDKSITDLRVNKDADTINITSEEIVVTKIPTVEVTETVDETQLININTAKLEELIKIQGIGQKTAEKIINHRPYNSLDELSAYVNIHNIDLVQLKV